MSSDTTITNYYAYNPSHVLPIVFAVLIGISLIVHTWQNFRYRFWRVTFWMTWGGTVFTAGWISRVFSSYDTGSKGLYIAQTVLVLAGPPIYAASEYNILGRLMLYLPMHAPMNPNRLVYFFIYLGALVESLTAAGASKMSSAGDDRSQLRSGGTLLAISLILQGVVECIFFSMVVWVHHRAAKAKMVTPKVHTLCIMLYGTSALILLRCIFRAIEKFSTLNILSAEPCSGICDAVQRHEWYLYAFEAAPMVLYTYWLNIIHPGRILPEKTKTFLDFDRVERVGPGWKDRRSVWMTFIDPFDLGGKASGQIGHEQFWLQPDDWPAANDIKPEAVTGSNLNKIVQQPPQSV
ncbi:hypothetical protein NA57DRAFT_73859 [Rhizodiscina lignyota]|uniref:RTA1 domain protein n=1 Tax=Rhizodiscina lignyota TaxID=1504668 RepID=A0A9P4IJ43_9PEZI|nr:hypothetical protein NA57DRAFT_73859 [Rhizodiscina lignyota]